MQRCTFCNEHVDEGDTCPRCGCKDIASLPDPPPSKLVIEFAGPGSALFNMYPEGVVTPEQLAVVGQFLLTRAREMWRMQLEEAMGRAEEEQKPKIAVPGVGAMPADILRGMK